MKREKKDAEALILEMREVGEKVKDLDNELRTVEEDLERLMLSIQISLTNLLQLVKQRMIM